MPGRWPLPSGASTTALQRIRWSWSGCPMARPPRSCGWGLLLVVVGVLEDIGLQSGMLSQLQVIVVDGQAPL